MRILNYETDVALLPFSKLNSGFRSVESRQGKTAKRETGGMIAKYMYQFLPWEVGLFCTSVNFSIISALAGVRAAVMILF